VAAHFLTLFEQHLHTDTDAQQWSALFDYPAQRVHQPNAAQAGHAIAKGSHARQHDLFGSR